mgnify:CR=1 FL=1
MRCDLNEAEAPHESGADAAALHGEIVKTENRESLIVKSEGVEGLGDFGCPMPDL